MQDYFDLLSVCCYFLQLLKEKSELWRRIIIDLERDNLTGDAMPLKCKNHPETVIKVKCQADFEKVPEGNVSFHKSVLVINSLVLKSLGNSSY